MVVCLSVHRSIYANSWLFQLRYYYRRYLSCCLLYAPPHGGKICMMFFKICTHIQSERKSRCKNVSTKFQNIIQQFVMRRDAEGEKHIKCIRKCWVRNNHNLYRDSCNWQFYFAMQASIRCNQDVNCFRIVMSYFNIFQIIFSWLICCFFFSSMLSYESFVRHSVWPIHKNHYHLPFIEILTTYYFVDNSQFSTTIYSGPFIIGLTSEVINIDSLFHPK